MKKLEKNLERVRMFDTFYEGIDMSKISTEEEAYNYGVQIAREKVARSLLKDNYEIDMIHEVTGLPIEEIAKLQRAIIEIEIYKRFFKSEKS